VDSYNPSTNIHLNRNQRQKVTRKKHESSELML